MSEREQLEKLRRLKELMAREAAKSGVADNRDPAEVLRQQEESKAAADKGIQDLKQNPGGFLKNALKTAGARINDLYSNIRPGDYKEGVIEQNKAALAEMQEQPGGSVGTLAGDVVATLPAGAIGGTVRAARGLAGAGKLARAATSRPAAAAAEGAAIGGVLGDNPVEGAALSTTLNLIGRGLGKTVTGPVTKSAEAKSLQELAESQGLKLDLPVGVAAKNKVLRKTFGDLLPSLPGAQNSMARQGKELQYQIDDLATTLGVEPREVSSLLGGKIRTPTDLEKRGAWALATSTGLAPKVVPVARAASSGAVSKALLGDYEVQRKIAALLKKSRPASETARRAATVEGVNNE